MRKCSLCALVAVMLVGRAAADPPSDAQTLDITKVLAMAGGAKVSTAADDSDLPKFDEVTKGMKSTKGLFTLWSYPDDAKDKDGEKLLAQIPGSLLGEKFMLSISFSGGGFFTGFPLEEKVVQWELRDKQLVLVEPETRFVVQDKDTVGDVVSRTYPDRIRAAVPLVTRAPSGDPVIDLGPMLKSDFADIGWMSFPMPGMMGIGGGGINNQLSKWTKKKTFELNTEIGVELAIGRSSPPGSFEKKLVHYSFWRLPQTNYSPRVADDRIGYFLTANQDWSKPTDSRDIFNRFVDRWQLEKRDPSLKVCEPKKPIVFYIEKTVPVRFRRAVRDGILEWNRAFEKCGFVNAVEVRQQTHDNEWKDLDPEDMRFSFFRWIVTGAGFAMGPHRANPFTGQIYDADIIFDDSMVRYFEQSAADMLPEAAMSMKTADLALSTFLERFPQFGRPQRDWTAFHHEDRDAAELRKIVRTRLQQRGSHLCDYSHGMGHQVALGRSLLAGQPAEVIEEFLYDVVKEVVMHEVGHTLGLRHNFKASSVWSLDDIRQRSADGLATTGSVMDYNPVLFFKDNPHKGDFITSTIGPYDYWAIEYGYRPADGSHETAPKPADTKAKETKTADNSDDGGATKTATVNTNEIPPEVLAQLPPEVKKMIESGAAARFAEAGAKPEAGKSRPSASPFAGINPAEAKMLQEIASRAAEPELAYATDEDTTILGADPRSNRFDMGADPIDWARTRVQLVDDRMASILEWGVKDQESWYHLRQSFLSLLMEKAFVLDYVGRYIGGQHTSRTHRGDPNAEPPLRLVDAKVQRDALAFIEDNLFSDKFFKFNANQLNHLAAPRWWHDGSVITYVVDFPVHDLVGTLQWWNLFDRMFPYTLRRIHDAELKAESTDKLTCAEYIQRVQNGCWNDVTADRVKGGDTWTDESPFLSSVRRSLQREYLNVIEPLVRTPPGRVVSPDIHAMVQHAARNLGRQIEDTLAAGKLDFATQAHLTACKSRIDRMLAPQLTEYGSANMGF